VCKPFFCVHAEMLQWKFSDPEKILIFLKCFCREHYSLFPVVCLGGCTGELKLKDRKNLKK